MTDTPSGIDDIAKAGRRIVVRVDFNVPLDGDRITDETRLMAALPTLELLRDRGARTVLISHLGRPIGPDPKYSLAPVAKRLGELLGNKVHFCDSEQVVCREATDMASEVGNGEFLLLENLRFNSGEKQNDPEFAEKLASLGDYYVDDAFGASHRSHASVVGIADYLPAVPGLLLERELSVLGSLIKNPKRPFAAVLGGSKVSDKIAVIKNLIGICDKLLIGGGMCFTFFKARGGQIGDSLCEDDQLDYATEIVQEAEAQGVELILPTDIVIAQEFSNDTETKVVPSDEIPAGWLGLDIGPDSATAYASAVCECQTVFWNGPMGVFEIDAFANGTEVVARAIANCSATTIAGGGDTDAAIHKYGLGDKITHVSTGGGASMKLLEGMLLPGVEVLKEQS